MKRIEFTFNEAFYIFPAITSNSFVFLFFIFWFKKDHSNVIGTGYITPFFAIHWNKKKISLWALLFNKGFILRFNEKPFFQIATTRKNK